MKRLTLNAYDVYRIKVDTNSYKLVAFRNDKFETSCVYSLQPSGFEDRLPTFQPKSNINQVAEVFRTNSAAINAFLMENYP